MDKLLESVNIKLEGDIIMIDSKSEFEKVF